VSLSVAMDEMQEAQRYVDDFVKETGWQPADILLPAGALRYSEYDYFKQQIIKFMVMSKGKPGDTMQDHEFTDWEGGSPSPTGSSKKPRRRKNPLGAGWVVSEFERCPSLCAIKLRSSRPVYSEPLQRQPCVEQAPRCGTVALATLRAGPVPHACGMEAGLRTQEQSPSRIFPDRKPGQAFPESALDHGSRRAGSHVHRHTRALVGPPHCEVTATLTRDKLLSAGWTHLSEARYRRLYCLVHAVPGVLRASLQVLP